MTSKAIPPSEADAWSIALSPTSPIASTLEATEKEKLVANAHRGGYCSQRESLEWEEALMSKDASYEDKDKASDEGRSIMISSTNTSARDQVKTAADVTSD